MTDQEDYRDTEESGGLDLQRIFEILKRRRRVMLLSFLGALVLALVVPFLLPAHYRGVATISFERTPAVLMFGVDFMPQAGYQPSARTSALAPMMALAESSTVLGRVVDASPDMGIEVEPTDLWERLRIPQRMNSLANWGLLPEEESAAQERQAKIGGLRRSLQVGDVGRSASILGISVGHPEAQAAAALSNAVAESLVGYLIEQRNAASRAAIAWLRQKSSELREEIQKRELVLVRLAEEAELPIGSTDTTAISLQQLVSEELRQTRVALLAAEMQLSTVRPRVHAWAGASTDAETALQSLEALRTQYLKARERLDLRRSSLTENHPAVLRQRALVEKLEQELTVAGISNDGTQPDWLSQYRRLTLEHEHLEANAIVLEESLSALATDPENEAEGALVTEHERTLRQLDIDRELLEVVLTRLNETLLSAGTEHGAATILDRAVPPALPESPNRPRAIGIGLALAAVFGVGMGMFLELIDRSVYDASEAARELGVAYLGSIPNVSGLIPPEKQVLRQDVSPAGESFRNLRTAIQFQAGSRELRSLLITSAVMGEGKTTLAVNLATSFASGQRRVVLVDADLRRARVDIATGVSREPGLVEVLRAKTPLSEVIRTPEEFPFSVVPAGESPGNPPELLNSDAFGRILTDLIQQFDMVVIDAPVLLAVSDAQLLSSRVDGTLLVHSPGATDRRAFQRMRVNLERARAQVLGLVYNKVATTDLDPYEDYLREPAPGDAARPRDGATNA